MTTTSRTSSHPGEVLDKKFLKPKQISKYRLAQDLNVPITRIIQIVDGERGITADTALRLARYFKVKASYWLELQANHDLKVAHKKAGKTIEKDVQPFKA